MGAMNTHPLPLPGLLRIDTSPSVDSRGEFVRVSCSDELSTIRPDLMFAQVNLSTTLMRGSVRGLHYQVGPAWEAKMIRCLRGRVFDVAVDLRADSSTFLQWHAIELDASVQSQVYIPEGFAHGFQALTDDVQLLYFHTTAWRPDCERRLHFNAPRLAIRWPLPVTSVSEADASAPALDQNFRGVAP